MIIKKILSHLCIICGITLLVIQVLDWFNPLMDFMGHAIFLLYIVRERHHPGNDRDLQRMSRRSCTEYKSTAITVLLRSVIFKPALCALRRSRT